MAFNDFRDPIEYVVNQYFERKRYLNNNLQGANMQLNTSDYADEDLPEYPITLIRDEQGLVTKVIYGDLKVLERLMNEEEEEGCPIIWQEEIIRDAEGTTVALEKTYPDGIVTRVDLVRENDVVTEIQIGDSP